ncbi:hypothetical protein DPMN_143237 [Dreissena polymorpha]|uniref:Uncharacterized protein n=1 Tax=Dreissena polymorpha TaxID=45954 RepID=A0A9D4JN09_DREPO|nr:hypothetical protein DPMN_143237 [Dreissena polymorpha]
MKLGLLVLTQALDDWSVQTDPSEYLLTKVLPSIASTWPAFSFSVHLIPPAFGQVFWC